MGELFKYFGAGGFVGLLVGIVVAAYIDATDPNGSRLVVVICVVLFGLIGAGIKALFGRGSGKSEKDDKSDKNDQSDDDS